MSRAGPASPEKLTLTPAEAAVASGLGLAAIAGAIRSGELVARWKPPGKRYRVILREDLLKYLNALPLA